jgi:hypothetical protein
MPEAIVFGSAIVAFIVGCIFGRCIEESQWTEGLTPFYALLSLFAAVAVFRQLPEHAGNIVLAIWFPITCLLVGCLLRQTGANIDSPDRY